MTGPAGAADVRDASDPREVSEVREVRTTCPYCGVGCGVVAQVADEPQPAGGTRPRIVGVRGDETHPANRGRLCSKGSALHHVVEPAVSAQVRAAVPELRRDRAAQRVPVDWDEALDFAAERFARIIERDGPDAVAFYVSGQLLTEDYYVFNKLARAVVGTNNIDSNSRLCMSSAVSGYKVTLGADGPPACYDDIDHADCVLVAGSNMAWAHPVLFRRLEDARRARPHLRLVVVDPRRTDTAEAADLHLAIRPGTDVALFHGMLHAMLWEGLVDREFITQRTEGFDALRALVRDWTPAAAARVCGIEETDLVTAARWFAQSPATLSMWCQGLNQSVHGTDANAALIGLHLATGQIGRAGAGPLSLTGQPNAMGGREVGALATLGVAHRELSDPAAAAEMAAFWGVPGLPAAPGATAVDLFEAIGQGRVKAVWIACTNPAQSMPDAARVRTALERAELVVVQDAYRTPATVDHADLLLPASGWGEKSGTVTNSERRISRVRAVLPAYGQSRADWAIAADFGRRLQRRLGGRPQPLLPWTDGEAGAEAIWNEHRETTRGRDLDIGGLSWDLLDRLGPQQWPCPPGASDGRARLYEGSRFATPSGRARFSAPRPAPPAEQVDARHPFVLNTGRLRDQWHGMSRTGTVARLAEHAPEPTVDLHPIDAQRRGFGEGELLRLSTRRGSLVLPLRVDASVARGSAFVAMHWGPEALGGTVDGRPRWQAGVNALTSSATDPVSRQPALKHAALRLEPARLPVRLVAFGWLPPGRALALRGRLRRMLDAAGFVSVALFGREEEGVSLRAASGAAFDPVLLDAIEAAFVLPGASVSRYDDPRRGTTRRVALADGRLGFVLLSGDCASEPWLRALLRSRRPVAAAATLLAPGAVAPVAVSRVGGTVRDTAVCSCVGVSDRQIRELVQARPGPAPQCLDMVRARLGCGTGCGSCVPQVRRIVDQALFAVPAVGEERRPAGDGMTLA